jgi:GT2 family glycosyltransferase
MGQDQPFFSIVIPTYRRPRQLAVCLQALSRLDYPRDRFEVIVVDDGGGVSLDSALAPFRETLAISLLRQPQEGPSGARNAGAAMAKGDFLAFTADDCVPAADWLRTFAARFAARPGYAFGGKIVNAVPGNSFSTASHLLIMYLYEYYNALPEAARFFTPNNLAVPADRFRAMGGFDVSFVTAAGEDRELCDRWLHSGYPMAYAPEVVVAHAHPLTFPAFCRQQFGYGRGTFRHRLMQAQRTNGCISLEPARFYFDLLRYPLTIFQEKKNRLAMLLGISQVANALGFFWESTLVRSHKQQRATASQ